MISENKTQTPKYACERLGEFREIKRTLQSMRLIVEATWAEIKRTLQSLRVIV